MSDVNENMSARECIYTGIAQYQDYECKRYWSKEKCLAIVMRLLRLNKQDTDENCILAERTVDTRLDNTHN